MEMEWVAETQRDPRRALKVGAIELRRATRDWRREHRRRPAES